tara:strand:+ start:16099 stop:16410 length:312 start_codon:yes stop_codon:yes gene_type:complete
MDLATTVPERDAEKNSTTARAGLRAFVPKLRDSFLSRVRLVGAEFSAISISRFFASFFKLRELCLFLEKKKVLLKKYSISNWVFWWLLKKTPSFIGSNDNDFC